MPSAHCRCRRRREAENAGPAARVARHRLYLRLGFERDLSLDWKPVPDLWLLGFRLKL